MLITTEQMISAFLLMLGAFLLGYMKGKKAERQRFKEFVLSSVLKTIQNRKDTRNDKETQDEPE